MDSQSKYQSNEARWQAVVDRKVEGDGLFVYSVRTTGIYCRPQCAARRPLRENVAFFETGALAEAAGFRPCKRCRPHLDLGEQDTSLIQAACRWIEDAEHLPSLAELAKRAGVSTSHFHRVFKRITGVTPKAYATAHRGKKVQSELRSMDRITDAIYEAGYQSSSRFYEAASQRLGMTPNQYRQGGEGLDIQFAVASCPLGKVLVAATKKGICAVYLGESHEDLLAQLSEEFPRARLVVAEVELNQWLAEVVMLIGEGRTANVDLPLDIRGTAFQQQVWQALREIPVGSTRSYAEVARSIGKPKAARAVAKACATNRIAVLIPCHRVVRANGDLSGYRWGVSRKKTLLEREAD